MMGEVLFNTNDVAKMLQVDKSTVKRWADEKKLKCFRTPGGHRKFRAEDLYNFMTEYNYGVSTLRIIPEMASDELIIKRIILNKEYNVLHSVCFSAAIKGKKDEIITLFSEVYRAGLPTSLMYDHILKPTLKKLSDTLRGNKISVLENTLAINSLSSAVIRMSEIVTKFSRNGKAVVCASLLEESNEVAFTALTSLFEINGYTVLNIGTAMPAEIVNQLLEREHPYAVCLFNSSAADDLRLAAEVSKVVQSADAHNIQCILGGEAFTSEIFRSSFQSAKVCTSFSDIDVVQYGNSTGVFRQTK